MKLENIFVEMNKRFENNKSSFEKLSFEYDESIYINNFKIFNKPEKIFEIDLYCNIFCLTVSVVAYKISFLIKQNIELKQQIIEEFYNCIFNVLISLRALFVFCAVL